MAPTIIKNKNRQGCVDEPQSPPLSETVTRVEDWHLAIRKKT